MHVLCKLRGQQTSVHPESIQRLLYSLENRLACVGSPKVIDT